MSDCGGYVELPVSIIRKAVNKYDAISKSVHGRYSNLINDLKNSPPKNKQSWISVLMIGKLNGLSEISGYRDWPAHPSDLVREGLLSSSDCLVLNRGLEGIRNFLDVCDLTTYKVYVTNRQAEVIKNLLNNY